GPPKIGKAGPLLDRIAIAIDGKTPKADTRARFGREDSPAAKVVGRSQNRVRPNDLHIARAIRQRQLGVNFSDAERQPDRSRAQRFANGGLRRLRAAGEEQDAEAESQRQVKSQKAKVKSQKCIGSACAAQINSDRSTLRESKHF